MTNQNQHKNEQNSKTDPIPGAQELREELTDGDKEFLRQLAISRKSLFQQLAETDGNIADDSPGHADIYSE